MARKKYKLLSYNDRKRIEAMYLSNEYLPDIAAKIGVHTATLYRELERGYTGELDKNLRSGYSADVAQRMITASLKNRGHTLKKAD